MDNDLELAMLEGMISGFVMGTLRGEETEDVLGAIQAFRIYYALKVLQDVPKTIYELWDDFIVDANVAVMEEQMKND